MAICAACGQTADGRFCGNCGSEVGKETVLSGLSTGFLGPFIDYFRMTPHVINPVLLTDEVKSKRFTWSRTMVFLASAVFLASIVEYFFPSESLQAIFPNLTFPGASEAIELALILGLNFLLAWPLHLMLNIGKKGVTFGQFMIVTLAVTAIFYPWLTLASGILTKYFHYQGTSNPAALGTLIVYVQAYKLLYSRSMWSTILIYTLYILMIIALLIGVVIWFESLTHGQG